MESRVTAQTELRYIPELSSVRFDLFEVGEEVLKALKENGRLVIKSYQPPEVKAEGDLTDLAEADASQD